MRRLWLITLGLALSASAQAQTTPGVIHLEPAGAAVGRISGAPNSTPIYIQDGPANLAASTALKYDGRYRYAHYVDVGTMPVSGHPHRDYYLWDEGTDLDIKLTNFRGPLYAFTRLQWSNDRADTFLSFVLEDPVEGRYYVVRTRVDATTPAWGPVIVAQGDAFEPFDEADLLPGGRLEVVLSDTGTNALASYVWTASNDVVAYSKSRQVNGTFGTVICLHRVGDTPLEADPIVFDELLTGCRPLNFGCSPTSGQVVVFVRTRSVDRKGNVIITNPSGFVAFDLNNPAANPVWLLQETTGKSGLNRFLNLIIHPEGGTLAFMATRLSNNRAVANGLYRMPTVPGGPVSTIREWSTTGSSLGAFQWTR